MCGNTTTIKIPKLYTCMAVLYFLWAPRPDASLSYRIMFLNVSLNGFVVLHQGRYSSICDFEDWWLSSVKMDRFRISLSVLRNILAATHTYTGLSLLFFLLAYMLLNSILSLRKSWGFWLCWQVWVVEPRSTFFF